MEYGQQANNAYQGPMAQAQDIREASLRNKADETAKYVTQAHNLLDELEDALQGPVPRPGQAPGPPQPEGLRNTLALTCERSAVLVSRLSSLLASL